MDKQNLVLILCIAAVVIWVVRKNNAPVSTVDCDDGYCDLDVDVELEPEPVMEDEVVADESKPFDQSYVDTFVTKNNKSDPFEVDERVLSVDDLLPSTNNEWSKMNDLVDKDMKNKNFLTTRNLGINTVGSSLRNPCYDIRGAPPNPKLAHLPWGNSTIDYDNNTRHMEFVK